MTLVLIHFTVPAANFGGSELRALVPNHAGCLVTNYVWRGVPFVLIHSSGAFIKRRVFSLRVSHPLTSATSITGYALACCLLPVHFITHRLVRTDPALRISSLSPSELNSANATLSGCPRPSVVLYFVSIIGVCPARCRWDDRDRLVHMARGLRLPGKTCIGERRAMLPVLAELLALSRKSALALSCPWQRGTEQRSPGPCVLPLMIHDTSGLRAGGMGALVRASSFHLAFG
ncbi:hypothetical protein V8E53_004316 [Lactarius tabidus]